MKAPVILEFKIAKKQKLLKKTAEEALEQIARKHYDAPFMEDGYEECVHIGISFYEKMCQVKCRIVKLIQQE